MPRKLSQTSLSKLDNFTDEQQSSERLMEGTQAKTNGMPLVNGKATNMVNGVSSIDVVLLIVSNVLIISFSLFRWC